MSPRRGCRRTQTPPPSVAVLALLLLCGAATSVCAYNDEHMMRQRQRSAPTLIQHNSFSPPLLRGSRHSSDDGMPFWQMNGATVVTNRYVRLTPDAPRCTGHLWNREPVHMEAFEIVVGFRVHKSPSSPSSGGAEGFALWLTSAIPRYDGALMGHPMRFTGFGILFDTYDNDRMHDNPNVLMLYNRNGSYKMFTPARDYRHEYTHACRFDYRDFTGSSYFTARLLYNRGTVQLYLSDNDPASERLCFTAHDTYLDLQSHPYHIGFTAETGELSEAHDIVFVHTSPLTDAAAAT